MFLFISRVVVVSVLMLSLSITLAPAAHAKSYEPGKAETETSKSWVSAAVDWLNLFLGHQTKEMAQHLKKTTKIVPPIGNVTANSGPCIDPLGNPKPCP